MIKMLSKILLESTSPWAARDVIVSDMFEMFKSEEMVACFSQFFLNNEQDHSDPQAVYSLVRFQMEDPKCSFLTTGDVEQFYQVYDTGNSSFEARTYFRKMCEAYDRDKTSNLFSICPV